MIKKLVAPKVKLSEVAAPKPSRTATRVIRNALKRAYLDQKETSSKAQAIKAS